MFYAHRNDRHRGTVSHNTYAPVSENLAKKLLELGVLLYDRAWLTWHKSIAWQREYFDVEVYDCQLLTMQQYRDFIVEGQG